MAQAPVTPAGPAHNQIASSSADEADPDYTPTRPAPVPKPTPRHRQQQRRPPPQQVINQTESPSTSPQPLGSPLQHHDAVVPANVISGAQIPQETENETSVEFLSEAERASPITPPSQQTLDLVSIRKLVLAAAHRPFHVSRAPRIPYQTNPGRIAARNLSSLFDGKRHPGISKLRILFREDQTYTVGSYGELCAFRGRGPVWSRNSCAFDCVLVAARLLQAGLSPIDYGKGSRDAWLATFAHNQRTFLQAAVTHRWDIMTREQSMVVRDRLFDQTIQDCNSLMAGNNPLEHGDFLAVTTLWDHHMSSLNQFTFEMARSRVCTSCNQITSTPEFESYASVTPDQRQTDLKLSMEELFQQHFGFLPQRTAGRKHCIEGSVLLNRRVVRGTPPVRLVVHAPSRQRHIAQATADMTFRYKSSESKEDQQVTYRWLGGIYQYRRHYRVYFIDVPYGDIDGYMQIYDGNAAEGAIIGQVLPEDPDNKVPFNWARNTDILFYERVNQDNYDAVAQQVLYDNALGNLTNGENNRISNQREASRGADDSDIDSDVDAEGETDYEYEYETGNDGSNHPVGNTAGAENYTNNDGVQTGVLSNSRKRRPSSSSKSNVSTRSAKKVRIDTGDLDSLFEGSPDVTSQGSPASRSSKSSRTAKKPAAPTALQRLQQAQRDAKKNTVKTKRKRRSSSASTDNFSSEPSSSTTTSERAAASSRKASLRSHSSGSGSGRASTTSNRSSYSRSSSVKSKGKRAKKSPATTLTSKHPTTGGKGVPRKGPAATGGDRPTAGKKGPAATGGNRSTTARKGPAQQDPRKSSRDGSPMPIVRFPV